MSRNMLVSAVTAISTVYSSIRLNITVSFSDSDKCRWAEHGCDSFMKSNTDATSLGSQRTFGRRLYPRILVKNHYHTTWLVMSDLKLMTLRSSRNRTRLDRHLTSVIQQKWNVYYRTWHFLFIATYKLCKCTTRTNQNVEYFHSYNYDVNLKLGHFFGMSKH